MEHKELLKTDILYRFFSRQISDVDYKISKNADQLRKLYTEQEELKRGKKELVQLRRELNQRTTATIRH